MEVKNHETQKFQKSYVNDVDNGVALVYNGKCNGDAGRGE
jgi:hypothetical protein